MSAQFTTTSAIVGQYSPKLNRGFITWMKKVSGGRYKPGQMEAVYTGGFLGANVALSPDGRWSAATAQATIHLYDRDSGNRWHIVHVPSKQVFEVYLNYHLNETYKDCSANGQICQVGSSIAIGADSSKDKWLLSNACEFSSETPTDYSTIIATGFPIDKVSGKPTQPTCEATYADFAIAPVAIAAHEGVHVTLGNSFNGNPEIIYYVLGGGSSVFEVGEGGDYGIAIAVWKGVVAVLYTEGNLAYVDIVLVNSSNGQPVQKFPGCIVVDQDPSTVKTIALFDDIVVVGAQNRALVYRWHGCDPLSINFPELELPNYLDLSVLNQQQSDTNYAPSIIDSETLMVVPLSISVEELAGNPLFDANPKLLTVIYPFFRFIEKVPYRVCGPTTMWNILENGCMQCPSGLFKNSTGFGPCLPCPKGYFRDDPQASTCSPCDRWNNTEKGYNLTCPAGSS